MDILHEINLAGLSISLDGDRIKVDNAARLTDGLRALIRKNKPDIIARLSKTNVAHNNELQQAIREQIEERAAIMEYDGGLSRKDAEQQAARATRAYCYRVIDKPDRELWVIMPNTGLAGATASLKERYGDRLITVYENPYSLAGAALH